MVQPVVFDPSLPTREQFAVHAANEPCKSCHRLIDPVGFGFEHFDPVGRYRETEGGKVIDARGEIVSSPFSDGPFDGVAALGQKLAISKDADRCFVLQWFRFAYGSDESEEQTCTVNDLLSRFDTGQKKLDELVVALTKAPHFTTRLTEPLAPPLSTAPAADAGTIPPVPTTKPDAAPPTPPSDLSVSDHVDSQWSMGSCHTVTVTNEGTMAVTWRITLTISGTLSQNWSSTATAQGNQVTFSGADFNATIAPGESANFGYCVSL
jgi:cellulase/cellobiase CelA1